MSRTSSREIRVGLVIVAGLAGLSVLLALAGGGPGFLTAKTHIDVTFRDAQGLRPGSPVRIAGIDSGRVSGLELAEQADGTLRARVRIALTSDVAAKLRQDAKIVINASLTGQACINVVSSGRSAVQLVPGQVLAGVETSMFDPILEQVGLGPVERNHLSKTIAEVRQTVDNAGPRLRQIMNILQATAADFRETSEAIRPPILATARKLEDAIPRIEASMRRMDSLLANADGMVGENRKNIRETLASLRDLSATAQDIAATDRKKVETLLDGLNGTRARADRMLYQGDQLLGQGSALMAKNRGDLERTIANVRDATDAGHKLVQKLYGNPFYLSPFYKPTPEDLRTQGVHDMAQSFMMGAKELSDAVKTLNAMQGRTMTDVERQSYNQLLTRAAVVTQKLDQTSQLLADGLRPDGTRVRRRQ